MVGQHRPAVTASIDRRGVLRAWSAAMAEHQPESLRKDELALDRLPLTRPPHPYPVFAWVHYGPVSVRIAGHTTAWTERAHAVKWLTPTGDEHKAWVWASAVDPRRELDEHMFQTPADRGKAALEQAIRGN
jgi:hypothetical protein